MTKTMTMLALSVVFAAQACDTKGVPTEFGKACAIENEKKYIEVSGFLADRGGVFCSNIGGGRLECGFDLKETADGDKKLRVEIEQGTGANTVEKLESGYKKEDIKIRDNAGSVISPGDKVRLTGKMSISPDGIVCFMQVSRIER